jgi:3-deoxy-7-phosphoheptulonate synthase
MIIVLKRNSSETDIATVSDMVASLRYQPRVIRGTEQTVVACIGDELSHQSLEGLRNLPAVESVFPVQKKFKLVSREYHPADSVVDVRGVKIGGGHIEVIAGPCAIESYDQFRAAVRDLAGCGIRIIRAMPFKPRTSPYDFQGLKQDGLQIMREIKKEFDVAMISEVPGPDKIEALLDVADMFQIGARNAQNYDLLEQIAKVGKPVLLKRGLASTVEEWLTAAEYLIVNNCPQVVLCERGLRSFDPSTRNLLDLGRRGRGPPAFPSAGHGGPQPCRRRAAPRPRPRPRRARRRRRRAHRRGPSRPHQRLQRCPPATRKRQVPGVPG